MAGQRGGRAAQLRSQPLGGEEIERLGDKRHGCADLPALHRLTLSGTRAVFLAQRCAQQADQTVLKNSL